MTQGISPNIVRLHFHFKSENDINEIELHLNFRRKWMCVSVGFYFCSLMSSVTQAYTHLFFDSYLLSAYYVHGTVLKSIPRHFHPPPFPAAETQLFLFL